MAREDMDDLLAFLAVARDRSFTKAAGKLGMSQSSLSQIIRKLEARLGVRLLTRTTRSVSPTEAGDRLMKSIAPLFEGIDAAIADLGDVRDKPAGTVRITCSEHPASAILGPKLLKILPLYPDLKVELMIEQGYTDIAADGFDAGVRLGENLEKDMIAVRIGPEMRMVVVGSPDYFATHPVPETPQDLTSHNCVNLRLTSSGGLYAWEFEKEGRALRVRVDGQLTMNSGRTGMDAVLAGLALAYLPEDLVQADVDAGRMVKVLEDWCQTFPGFHLYYPSRRQMTPAFAVVVDALRYRA